MNYGMIFSQAYEKWRSENGEDLKLPGLEHFSEDQLFFLNNAQVFVSLHFLLPELNQRYLRSGAVW